MFRACDSQLEADVELEVLRVGAAGTPDAIDATRDVLTS
jgi:hypothetical protein